MNEDEQPQTAPNSQSGETAPETKTKTESVPAPGSATHGESALIRSPFVNAAGEPVNSAMKDALDEFWTALKRLPAYLRLATALGRDNRVPKSAKALLVTGGAYAVSPLDLVPGVIPVAGQLDDLYVILTAIQQAVRLTPEAIANEHLANAAMTRDDIDHDLAAVRRLVKEAAIASARFGLRAVKDTGNRLRRFAGQNLPRGGAKRDNKPL